MTWKNTTEFENAIAISEPYFAMLDALRNGMRADYEVLEFLKAVNKFEGGDSLAETIAQIELDIMEDDDGEIEEYRKQVQQTYYHGQTGCRNW